MRVHEFAKQLTAELGKEVKSSQIIDILSGKKEGLKAQSSIDDAMMKFVRESLGGNKPVEAKKEEPKRQGQRRKKEKRKHQSRRTRRCSQSQTTIPIPVIRITRIRRTITIITTRTATTIRVKIITITETIRAEIITISRIIMEIIRARIITTSLQMAITRMEPSRRAVVQISGTR